MSMKAVKIIDAICIVIFVLMGVRQLRSLMRSVL